MTLSCACKKRFFHVSLDDARHPISIESRPIVCSCSQVDLRHLSQTEDSNRIEVGIDLTDYYISVEWDIIKVPAMRSEAFYICCEEPYPDIVFNITLRRKTLFYTVNLIIPCVGISFLSVLVFYLPSDSGEKVSLSISILLSLTVFFLLLAEIIPPTSLTVPLLGKYLLFTMVLVTLSVVVTIAVLNVNFRSPVTHRMSRWVRVVFIQVLPRFLLIKRPKKEDDDEDEGRGAAGIDNGGETDDDGADEDEDDDEDDVEAANGKPPEGILTDVFHVQETDKRYGKRFSGEYEIPQLPPATARYDLGAVGTVAPRFEEPLPSLPLPGADDDLFGPASPGYPHEDVSPTFEKPLVREIEKTIDDARFIAQHAKNKDKFESVSMTLRLFSRSFVERSFSFTAYASSSSTVKIRVVDRNGRNFSQIIFLPRFPALCKRVLSRDARRNCYIIRFDTPSWAFLCINEMRFVPLALLIIATIVTLMRIKMQMDHFCSSR